MRLSGLLAAGIGLADLPAQEIGVPHRRYNTSVIEVVADQLRGAELRGGGVNYGNSSVSTFGLNVMTPVADAGRTMWDAGFEWRRMEFSYYAEPGSPGALQAVDIPVVASWELGEVTTLGVMIKPGIYSDMYDIGLADVNVPGGIRLFHEHHPDLLWTLGLQFDPWHEIPVIPDFGVRWRFWYDFVLNASLPNPRLEYEMSDRWAAYVGFQWRGGTYRVSRNTVASGGLPGTDNATLTFRDLRVGAGFRYAWSDESHLTFGAGYSFYRHLNYDRGGQLLRAHGSPYIRFAVHGEW